MLSVCRHCGVQLRVQPGCVQLFQKESIFVVSSKTVLFPFKPACADTFHVTVYQKASALSQRQTPNLVSGLLQFYI